jgi:subtilisin family serine protease
MRTRSLLAAIALVAAIAPALPGGASSSAGWYEVTFAHRLTQADHDAVRAAGGDIVAYVPANTYLAWFDAKPTVEGASVSLRPAAEKVDPYLSGTGKLHLVALVAAPAEAQVSALLGGLGDIADVRPNPAHDALIDVFITADVAAARMIAGLDSVLYIGPESSGLAPENEASAQIVAGNVTGTTIAKGYEAWQRDVGVTGKGVRVTIVDSGIDPRHPDLAGAIEGKVDRSQSPTGEPMDGGGHGTHVAGIVAGRGLGLSGTGQRPRPTDSGGYIHGLGVAPEAGLVDQNYLANTAAGPLCGNTWPPAAWEPMTADALAKGSSLSNSSWQSCEGTGVGYIRSASEMDRLTRDGDSSKPGAQPFTMVFSAGNSGAGTGNQTMLTAPKEAKNTIVVASSGASGTAINQVASTSSRGPAKDGRWVPTVTAPGNGVLSTRSTTATASCSTPLTDPGPESLLYASCSGTSMAAPHATGAVALLTQWWRQRNAGADPSPAMSKALLVNTATDMGAADIPNRHEGWGRVDLGNLFDQGAQRAYVDQSVLFTDPGDQHTVQVPVDGTGPLRVSTVWTDAPGAVGASPALVNDLDLVVTAPDGTVYSGNIFSKGVSIPGTTADRINNVENVFVNSPQAGTWTVEVRAANLPGDGVPFAGDATDQDFALVVSS